MVAPMYFFVSIWTQLLLSSRAKGPTGTLCPKVSGKPGCVCNHIDGIIDLTPLQGVGGAAK